MTTSVLLVAFGHQALIKQTQKLWENYWYTEGLVAVVWRGWGGLGGNVCVLAMVGRKAEESYVQWVKDSERLRGFAFASFALFFLPMLVLS